MITFTLIIISLIALALIFILPTLLRRPTNIQHLDTNRTNANLLQQQLEELNQDLAAGILDTTQYAVARKDLERIFLHSINNLTPTNSAKTGYWAAPLLAIGIPVFTITTYLLTGNYPAIVNATDPAQLSNENNSTLPPMDVLVKRLAERMQTRPNDLAGWIMLGRSAMSIGQKQLAADAYAQVLRLNPKEIDILLDYADVLSQTEAKFTAKALELVTTALSLNPNHPRALWMMGLVEFQNSGYDKALTNWSQLKLQLPPASKEASALNRLITEAQQRKDAIDMSLKKTTNGK